ncbi:MULTISPECIES: hypothetical protein [unclassified Photorhabdus]|uniref:hypothetical protein n=1 Tax=unclassified Photorhabdus TaxID=2620880 RepID=UPI000DCD031A|nr:MULTISPECIES: hypothetical protein [unclassified Photorhabdus]RAW92843.1 hypothetical protein CKY03_22645 [Photorhabdus sp. S9-53]RAW93144.1 hypothetical protein CKY05_22565 [Photorhabdus sp. S10-54]RAW96575.1 hypothetical protein CKY04_22585 [Photorhabdus sp. S8-52]
MINNSFHLTQVIASAWGDPSYITDAVWNAGYRKAARTSEEIVLVTLKVIEDSYYSDIVYEYWPKDLEAVLAAELNFLIDNLVWSDKTTPATVAKVVLDAGYRKE